MNELNELNESSESSESSRESLIDVIDKYVGQRVLVTMDGVKVSGTVIDVKLSYGKLRFGVKLCAVEPDEDIKYFEDVTII